MGYEIVYEKAFVKTDDDRIIPLVLSGSNNCYSTEWAANGRMYEKRERSWHALYTNGRNMNIAHAKNDLLRIFEKTLNGKHQEHFMRRGDWVDDEMLMRFVKSGIKNARTIEELNDQSVTTVSLNGSLHVWSNSTTDFYNDGTPKSDRNTEGSCSIQTSEDLAQFLKIADNRIATAHPSEGVYVSLAFRGEKAILNPKNRRNTTPTAKPDTFWTIQSSDGYYLSRLTKNGAKLSPWEYDRKVFKTKEKTEVYIEEYGLNTRFTSDRKYVAVFVDNQAKIS